MFEVSFVIIKRFTDWYEYTAAAIVLLHSIAAYFGSLKNQKRKKLLTSFTSSFLQKTLKKIDGLSGESKSMLLSELESSNGPMLLLLL
jgi:hypothetical protein